MSLLIFANQNDKVAKELVDLLMTKSIDCTFVTDTALCTARSWTHQCDADGIFNTVICLADGREICSDACNLVFNRIRFLQSPFFIGEINRQYAEMEWYALFVSFLKSIEKALLTPFQTIHMNGNYEQYLPYYLHSAAIIGLPIGNFIRSSKPVNEPSLTPFRFEQGQSQSFFRQLNALDHVNRRPVIYLEKVFSKEKYLFIDGCEDLPEALLPYQSQLDLLAQKLGYPMLELTFGNTDNGIKILNINPFPVQLTKNQLESFVQLLLKKQPYDITTWNTVGEPDVISC